MKANYILKALALSATLFMTFACTHDEKPKSRMDRSRLNIGTYILQPYARSESHIKDLSECGIDFVVCMENDREALDLFSKYGVGAIVSGVLPGWWGGDGDNAGKLQETNPLSKYIQAAGEFEDHPAIWGIDIGDEPSALDFPYYGEVYATVDSLFPNQFPYLNLYPNYASVSQNTGEQTVNQLGTPTYDEHIQEYVRNVNSDYICYDFYCYSINIPKAYQNLIVVADACRKNERSMWIILQVNSNVEDKWISLDQLRFQAWTAMAFGVENITWACYTAGWWNNQVVDANGQKTEQYPKLKQINTEIRSLADAYMKYRNTATSFVGFDGTPWLEEVPTEPLQELNDGVFSGVCFTDGTPMVAGSMTARKKNAGNALFLTSADDPYGESGNSHTLKFKADGKKVTLNTCEGIQEITPDQEGWYTYTMTSNSAVLIEAK